MQINASRDFAQAENYPSPYPLSSQQLLDGICSDFETGCVNPLNTLSRLHKAGFLATPDELAAVFVAGFRALSNEGGAR